MSEQGNLLAWVPRTHTGDPATSHRAEDELRKSGQMGAHARIVLDLVRAYPGRTSTELAAVAPPSLAEDAHRRLYQIRRRLSDLRTMGLIERSPSERTRRESVWAAA